VRNLTVIGAQSNPKLLRPEAPLAARARPATRRFTSGDRA
jgi:hypothetical protein